MIKIDVWLTFPDGAETLCGEILCQDPDLQGRIKGEFRYAASYLDYPDPFPLDPENLPFKSGIFQTDRPAGVFAVFEDSLPDDWGRKLLIRKAKLPRGKQTIPRLLIALGGNGLGALSYSEKIAPEKEKYFADLVELDSLLSAATRIENGDDIEDDQIRALFRAGSSPGGARPKVLVKIDDGSQWIAKFPSVRDTMDMVSIEAATMLLAKKAGMNVPECRTISIGKRKIFLVRRFDISAKGGRNHMVSMQTLLKAEGWYNMSYIDVLQVVKKYSQIPEIDIPGFYRQLVFNALIGNTDDHLKNFAMICDKKGYRLSPAYDLMPDTENRKEHVLFFEYDHYSPGKKTAIGIGKKMGVKQAERIFNEVKKALTGSESEFEKTGVPHFESKRLCLDIKKRLKKA